MRARARVISHALTHSLQVMEEEELRRALRDSEALEQEERQQLVARVASRLQVPLSLPLSHSLTRTLSLARSPPPPSMTRSLAFSRLLSPSP